jgi:hypothetical protein
MRTALRSPFAALAPASVMAVALASAMTSAGCILDLDHLSSGGSGTTTSAGSGGGGSADKCARLECGKCEESCPEGGCAPTVIANGPGIAETPMGIAITPGALYWVNQTGGAVMRLRGDASPPAMLAKAKAPHAVAASSDLVVWLADDGVFACSPDDCEPTLLAAPVEPGSLREVAFDGTTVFWTDRGSAADMHDGRVMRCSAKDCQPQAVAVMQWVPMGLTVWQDTLFWTTHADGYPSASIFESPKLAAGTAEIAAGMVLPTGIATDDQNVYFTQWTTDGKVLRCPHSQGFCQIPQDVAAAAGPLGRPRDVAVTGGRVYFSTADDGAIRSCPAPACEGADALETHAAGRTGLHRMAVGASCVFFTDETDGGSVVKVAR